MSALIQLGSRRLPLVQVATVDDEDYDRIAASGPWGVTNNGYCCHYLYENKRTRGILMHRFILNLPTKYPFVDHINHNPLDNRKANLRVCTNAENMQNRRKSHTASSRYPGVHFHAVTQKWCARGMLNYKVHYLGVFPSEEEAAAVAAAWRAEHMPFSQEALAARGVSHEH